MQQYKSISEVLKKGQKSVNISATILMVTSLFLCLGLIHFTPEKYLPLLMIGGFTFSFLSGWLWWSFNIVKWRIWAFGNTKKSDWYDLRERAIAQKLIWKEGSIFEKTEFRSQNEQQQIEAIAKEIEVQQEYISSLSPTELADTIIDDPEVPQRLDFYYRRFEPVATLAAILFMSSFGIYMITQNSLIYGVLAIFTAAYLFNINKLKNIWKREIQLTLSDNGIRSKVFKQFEFINWSNTQDTSVDPESGTLYITTNQHGMLQDFAININEYDIRKHNIQDYDDFLRIVNIYIKRSLKNNKTIR